MSRRRQRNAPTRYLKRRRLGLSALILLGILAFGGIAYAIQLPRQAPALLQLAKQSAEQAHNSPEEKQAKLTAAVKFYEQYLKYTPRDAQALSELGDVYDELARTRLARPYEAIKLWDNALSSYHESLNQDGARHGERKKLARIYLITQKSETARKQIDLILKVPGLPPDAELYEMLAICEGTKHEAAAKHLRAGIATGEAPLEMYSRLAYLLKRDIGTPAAQQEAEDIFEKLIEKRPNDLAVRLARAKYFSDFNRQPQAQEDIRFAYETLPGGNANADVILAYAENLTASDLPAARAVLAKAREQFPDNPLIGLGLAELANRSADPKSAREILVSVLARLPEADPLNLELGDRLLDLGEWDSAQKSADRIAKIPPLEPFAVYLRGRVNAEAGEWPSAIEQLKQAIVALEADRSLKRKSTLLAKAYSALGLAYGQADNAEARLDAFRKAVLADPTSTVARLGLAEALSKSNRSEEASAIFRNLAPNSPTAKVALANLKLNEELRQYSGTGPRKLPGFWATVGPGPYPVELVPTIANAYLAEGKRDEAEKALRDSLKVRKAPAVYVVLSGLKATVDTKEAFVVLDEAERELGPTVDVQLARAILIARSEKPDLTALDKLASVEKLPPKDLARVQATVGDLLLNLGATKEGLNRLVQAAAIQKNDLQLRMQILDIAQATKDFALWDKTLGEVRAIEGADGPIGTVATITRELTEKPNPNAETAKEFTNKLLAARKQREKWGRIPELLGLLARNQNRPDEALEYYLGALATGERSEPLLREVVRLLLDRLRTSQALAVLSNVRSRGALSPELERQYQLLRTLASDPKAALAEIKSKRLTESQNPAEQLLRAQVLAQFGEKDEAEKALIAAEKLAPNRPETALARLRVAQLTGATPERLKAEFDNAAKVLKGDARGGIVLAQMSELLGDNAKAVELYREMLKATPTDKSARQALYELLIRTGKTPEAEAVLSEALAMNEGSAEVKRWAKRTEANRLASAPGGFKALPQALKLLDENIAEANQLEDVRAKAYLQAIDPFQRRMALKTLEESRAKSPFRPDEIYAYALLLLQGGRLEAAEGELIAATSNGIFGDARLLDLLAQILLQRGEIDKASKAIERLKLLSPNFTTIKILEAQTFAKSDPQRAKELLTSQPNWGKEPAQHLAQGKLCERIGLLDDAEKEFAAYRDGTDPATNRESEWIEFLIRRNRTDEAVKRIQESKVLPWETAARLLVAMVRTQPEEAVLSAERPAWKRRVEIAEKWLTDATPKQKQNPEWLLRRAELAEGTARYDEAIDWLTQARDRILDKRMRAIVQNNLLALQALYGRLRGETSRQQANESINDLGPEPYALDTRALVQIGTGNAKAAVDDLEAALAYSAKGSYYFHLAQCHEALKDQPARDRALADAKKLGLKKSDLHPLEWSALKKLLGE